jgi:hypothetical protein
VILQGGLTVASEGIYNIFPEFPSQNRFQAGQLVICRNNGVFLPKNELGICFLSTDMFTMSIPELRSPPQDSRPMRWSTPHDKTDRSHSCDKNEDRRRQTEAKILEETETVGIPRPFSHNDIGYGPYESEVARHGRGEG